MGRDRRDGGSARYCSHCGDDLAPSMNYCPNCGAQIGRESAQSSTKSASGGESVSESKSSTSHGRRSTARSRRRGPTGQSTRATRPSRTGPDDATRRRLEARMANATEEGWKLEHDFGDHAVMVRRTLGSADTHLLIGFLTVWWTMGLANVVYGAYKYVEGTERMVVHGEPAPVTESNSEPEAAASSSLAAWIAAGLCWFTAAILGVVGLAVGVNVIGTILFVLAFAFGVVGLSAFPSVRDRFARRHSITTNGKTRSVDERTVASDRPCTACARPVGRGVERTYRSEFCVLGIPVSGSTGRNYYCRECANAERSAAELRRDEGPDPTDSVAASSSAVSDTESHDRQSDRESDLDSEPA